MLVLFGFLPFYIMPLFLYFCSRFSLLDGRGESLGVSSASWWRKVLLRRRLLEDGMDDPRGFGMMGWLALGVRGCEAWPRGTKR